MNHVLIGESNWNAYVRALHIHLNRKLTAEDIVVEDTHTLWGEENSLFASVSKFEHADALKGVATEYARSYSGDFSFMLAMKENVERFGGLKFANQIAGALNSMFRDEEFSQRIPAAVKQPQDISPTIHDGIYTVIMGGHHVTLRMSSNLNWMTKAPTPGTMTASYLFGPDNTSQYKMFAFVLGKTITPLKAFRDNPEMSHLFSALSVLLGNKPFTDTKGKTFFDSIETAEAYALEAGECWRCHRTLTVEESITRGMGPICAAKMGF